MFPGSGRVTGIEVENNYIALPGVIFDNIKRSGIHHLLHCKITIAALTGHLLLEICSE